MLVGIRQLTYTEFVLCGGSEAPANFFSALLFLLLLSLLLLLCLSLLVHGVQLQQTEGGV